MAQNRDRNWQDRDQQQRGGWQGGDDFGQSESQHHGFEESQGRGPKVYSRSDERIPARDFRQKSILMLLQPVDVV